MIRQTLYSIRMRASTGTHHLSGAERIVASDKINATVEELIARAGKSNEAPEHIEVNIDALGAPPLRLLTSLAVSMQNGPDTGTGRAAATGVLLQCGVSQKAIDDAMYLLSNGAAASGGNMRGAIIMDAQSGERLEPDKDRGVRASRVDWEERAFTAITNTLATRGLTHFRTREALALATKVAHAPGMMAELCWSDDPTYVAGYVSSLKTGYVRFPVLKDSGVPLGGRVFFIDRTTLDMNALVHYLQTEPVLISLDNL